jgi:hypothetical protein
MTELRARSAYLAVVLASVAAFLALGACTKPSRDLQPGSYRATLEVSGGELPFGLDVAKEEQGLVLYLVNGEERVPVTIMKTELGRLSAVMPGPGNQLSAVISGGELRGEIALAALGGARQSLPFKATLGQTWRFYAEPLTDNVDVAGRWAVTLTDDRGRTTPGVADLQQKFERVTGTFKMKDGEHSFLAGEVHGDELRLSRFDGAVGHLYHARVNARGELEGECWSLPAAHQRFVAARNPDAVLDVRPRTTAVQEPATNGP